MRIVLRFGRPCDCAAQVPAVLRERGGASVSVLRQSALTSRCATEACTCSANCALAGRFHRAVLRRCLRALCCAMTGAGCRDSAEKLWSPPHLVLLLDKVVDVPVLATPWDRRGSAVAVHRLVVVSSSWL